jgi:hypothetical protein
MIIHGYAEEEWAQVREGRRSASRACDEEAEAGHVSELTWWKGRTGEEQKAGNRDRLVGGAKEWGESSCEEEVERRAQEDGCSKEVGWP